ncbi:MULTISPECIES: hypothetical protein [Mesorhizobium]|uniref:Uncharacterized protein n=1 Tax=Mesorhizobium abyssinicae TaxID=1209958 RepID=A0ABU5AKL4_9HYPH|nr:MULTISPECIES: hypothetical protein [Mesorhizobium]MDX8435538.1 hypothetical protein [Mesorhizobium abyssinicae]MDX8537819.1 hypothetical protein [Mesorhizobium abyssinicae]RUW21513.1 hypothetical protein EOA34_24150 [Mesorhizobium sp. M4B.F.Ca.ET.013.02.1.1]RUW66931.1 hypothetical protein EOA31_30055 [Mesorhizobium sp. M4B.F.Ca.ET.049.02.1.2]RVD19956.1 hypothetical protein EN738_24655 [Mesorhizobium sp. M4B.F.Ca.ET.017.02.2.1]
MGREAVLGALTAINLVLLAGMGLMQILPAKAQDGTGMLRGSGLQIVDSQGRVRSSISVLPATAGEAETVLFRLIAENGQPSVKISASTASAGLSFVGGDDASYILLEADGPETRLEMVEPEGRKKVIEP